VKHDGAPFCFSLAWMAVFRREPGIQSKKREICGELS